MLRERLRLRRARVADAGRIARVGLDSARVEVREEPLEIPLPDFKAIWKQRLRTESHLTYLACTTGGLWPQEVLCGYLSVEAPLVSGHILTLYIAPKYMRQGVGSALLQYVEREVRAVGGRTLQTDVQPRNVMAHNFYQKYGFVFTDEYLEGLRVMRKTLLQA